MWSLQLSAHTVKRLTGAVQWTHNTCCSTFDMQHLLHHILCRKTPWHASHDASQQFVLAAAACLDTSLTCLQAPLYAQQHRRLPGVEARKRIKLCDCTCVCTFVCGRKCSSAALEQRSFAAATKLQVNVLVLLQLDRDVIIAGVCERTYARLQQVALG